MGGREVPFNERGVLDDIKSRNNWVMAKSRTTSALRPR